ncbi:MAG: prolipoprotein diacylglyceryl transferase, partial [Cyclobacteriaceae bacterium]|nr:prolipoprotein diacylglyceryl transferase [Cyclobacteriaceae bacterium]
GDDYAWAILIFAFIVIVFSALWAQIIEGSEKLKRPYGYYGALVGIIFASLVIWAIGFNVWVIIGVISVVMPWVQAIGRLRCLINGCCHGGKVYNPTIGIRYFHHRSRVCGISGMKGELLHPTPLYAILWLFLIGFILLSLWNHNFSSPFIFGLYLILTGIGRFVEEAYRGEVQTPILKGLRLYQWTAILSVIIGIIMTIIQVDVVVITSDFGWETILSAIIGGLFTTFAMGVDFPYSNARFSRLV